jgi:molybdate transport system substrate-binding protein
MAFAGAQGRRILTLLIRFSTTPLPLLLLAFTALGACSQAPRTGTLKVATASSLTATLKEIADSFAGQGEVQVAIIPGATGSLAQQLRNGAPFDIFLSADQVHVDQLIQEGLLAPESRMPFARGELVLVQSGDMHGPLRGLADLAHVDGSLAIANPDHAPYGAAARQALQNAGLWEALQDRLIVAETVRQAAMIVQSGNAAAGLIARSTALEAGLQPIILPDAHYAPIIHVGALTLRAGRHAQAEALLRFLLSPEGGRILLEHGFQPLETGAP